ncbi:MAG TPA: hypothetical protein PK899_03920, partial [Spirochaetota bacterium]|nr:hypothetical protein [Spirochaetota bacterium]
IFSLLGIVTLLTLPSVPLIGGVFLTLGGIFWIITLAVLKGLSDADYSHNKELKACREIHDKIVAYLKGSKIQNELQSYRSTIKDELDNAKTVAAKIDDVAKTLKRKEWDEDIVKERLSDEEKKSSPDVYLVKSLSDQLENIKKIKETDKILRNQLTKIKLNLNSIYSKILVIDINDKTNFDRIESDIQKILDRKIMVSKFEKELDDELKI